MNMSVKEAVENVKKQVEGIKGEVKETVTTIADTVPRPLKHRKTVILRKPVIETLLERRRSNKTY